MKVLLRNPGVLNIYSKLKTNISPLVYIYVASFAKEGVPKVQIIDLNINKKVLEKTDLDSFDLIEITPNIPRYFRDLKITDEVKKFNKTSVGKGYYVTFLKIEVLNTGIADVIVKGEEIFLNLLNSLENKFNLKNIHDISFIDNGKFTGNEDVSPPQNLDSLSFPTGDLSSINKYKSILNGITQIFLPAEVVHITVLFMLHQNLEYKTAGWKCKKYCNPN